MTICKYYQLIWYGCHGNNVAIQYQLFDSIDIIHKVYQIVVATLFYNIATIMYSSIADVNTDLGSAVLIITDKINHVISTFFNHIVGYYIWLWQYL